jgi:hypothetical protein
MYDAGTGVTDREVDLFNTFFSYTVRTFYLCLLLITENTDESLSVHSIYARVYPIVYEYFQPT